MEQVRHAETVGKCIANARKRDDRKRAVKADSIRAIVLPRQRDLLSESCISQKNVCKCAWTINLESCNIAMKCKINSEVEATD